MLLACVDCSSLARYSEMNSVLAHLPQRGHLGWSSTVIETLQRRVQRHTFSEETDNLGAGRFRLLVNVSAHHNMVERLEIKGQKPVTLQTTPG